MSRRRAPCPTPDATVVESALQAVGADELRGLIRDLLPWLDDRNHARLVNDLLDRAARSPTRYVPEGPGAADVSEIVDFVKAAKRVGYAEPAEVDSYLRQGMNAFLSKDYRAAFQIFRSLLIPVANADMDLGQDEMVDEVLGVDVNACAAQYVVSMYMTATAKNRGRAVLAAIDEVRGIGSFWHPLRELERVAVEPLVNLDGFLAQWRVLVEERAAKRRDDDWDSDEDHWLREVVHRMEGPDGLARLARASRRANDLREWCRVLVDAGDWKAALAAHDEAADLVTDRTYALGGFLDGAALAAEQLGRKDLAARLERAWREAPSVVRLRRWLGSSSTPKVLRRRVGAALRACPKQAQRQRAFLHVLQGDLAAAAKLLGAAPGLGWWNEHHPGHVLFPVFVRLLGGTEVQQIPCGDVDELALLSDRKEPRLVTPGIAEVLALAGIGGPVDEGARAAVLSSMRKAAEKRIAGVTENKRRRHYSHAASLALACTHVDPSPGTATWFAALRNQYRRYPALQRELQGEPGRS